MNILRAAASIAVLSCLMLSSASGDITLPPVISDGCVLQRNAQVPLWGWAPPGQTINIKADWGATASVKADSSGKWKAMLQTPGAGGPHTISLRHENGAPISLKDVMIGEVWICSGQSNMEWPVRASNNASAEIAAANHPNIRLFTVPNTVSVHPRWDTGGTWKPCSPDSVADFSAVGFFFGRNIAAELNVPIGLISADWGGTPVESWMSPKAIKKSGEFANTIDYLELIASPSDRVAIADALEREWWAGLDGSAPGGGRWLTRRVDPKAWRDVVLPWSFAGDLAAFDGVVYLRKELEVPAAQAGAQATLSLGPIDDYDDTWINGVHVGSTHASGQWNVPRLYEVPARTLHAGTNTIAVRVLDTGGGGGLNGAVDQLHLTTEDGTRFDLAGPWQLAVGPRADALPPRMSSAINANTPTVLYNGMIASVAPYGLRGVLWYQGESNRTRAAQYANLFPAMIKDWRTAWGAEGLPFYFVQIAPFNYGGDSGQAAELREAQAAALKLPNTGMVVTTDIGNPADIHPRNKQEVGRRLALWALNRTYGRYTVVHSGPMYKSMTRDGRSLRITFDHVGTGLVAVNGPLSHFEIAAEDGVFMPATAKIDGSTVVVSAPKVRRPVRVRFAWSAAPEPNLFNQEGLPAAPFRASTSP